jgi:hypothetical protein
MTVLLEATKEQQLRASQEGYSHLLTEAVSDGSSYKVKSGEVIHHVKRKGWCFACVRMAARKEWERCKHTFYSCAIDCLLLKKGKEDS